MDRTLPWLLINRNADGTWRYRWWDDVTGWVHGDPPTREKLVDELVQLTAAMLADGARTRSTQPSVWETLPDAVEDQVDDDI